MDPNITDDDDDDDIVGDDELDCNPFFTALQKEFRRDFDEALQIDGSLICVPRSSSLVKVDSRKSFMKLDRGLVRSHLFRPSPYFKGQYVNLSIPHMAPLDEDGRVIEIADKHIVRKSGFRNNNSNLKILQEELGYSMKGKSYKILIIERPLNSVERQKTPESCLAMGSSKMKTRTGFDGTAPENFTECERILQSFADGKVLANLDVKVLLFSQNYLLLSQYMDDAQKKLKSIIDTTLEEIAFEKTNLDARTNTTVQAAIESYVMMTVHPKVFPAICQNLKDEDFKISDKLLELRQLNVSAGQLGADPLFDCPLPATVVELATLDGLVCPRRKMQCLKNVIDLIMAEIKQNLQETQCVLTPPGGLPFLTSDNLIPVLLTAMVSAQLQHLASDLYYAENFVWSVSSKDVHSYSLVTFKAAVEFLKMLDISQLRPPMAESTSAKKEMSLEELMKVTESLEGKTIRSEDDDANTQWTPVDRQMERIARMIEASTRELTAVQHHGVYNT